VIDKVNFFFNLQNMNGLMEFLKNDYVGTGKKSAKKEVRTK